MHWYVQPREIKFSRRSRSHASGKVPGAKSHRHSFRLGTARGDGLRESLRGKRVGNFPYNGRGKETRWNGSKRIQHEPTCCPFIFWYIYIATASLEAMEEVNGRNVRASLEPCFGLRSIELFRYRCTRGLRFVIRCRADARGLGRRSWNSSTRATFRAVARNENRFFYQHWLTVTVI